MAIQSSQNSKIIGGDQRLDKLLAEIQVLESTDIMQPFLHRIGQIAKEPSSTRRSLLTDSLIFDLIAHSKARKEKEVTLASMREARSELLRLNSKVAKDLEIALSKAIDSENIVDGSLLKEKGLKLVKDEIKTLARISRRQAILKALAELGYEVRENMTTAWAEDGRIVIQKPNEKGYGIELGSVSDAEKFQIQLVSLEQSDEVGKISRDRDQETIWCSEFDKLQTLLEKSGSELIIEKAIPAGVKRLKQVQLASINTQRERRSKDATPSLRVHE